MIQFQRYLRVLQSQEHFHLDLRGVTSRGQRQTPPPSDIQAKIMLSTTTTTTNAPTTFMSLPLEIRNAIYRHCLANRSFIVVANVSCMNDNHKEIDQPKVIFNGGLYTTLLRTCRQIYRESRVILYAENLIYFSGRSAFSPNYDLTIVSRFFSATSTENLALIKHLALHHYSVSEFAQLLKGYSTKWPLQNVETVSVIKTEHRPWADGLFNADGEAKALHAAMEVCPSLQVITGNLPVQAITDNRSQESCLDRVVLHKQDQAVEQMVQARLEVLESVSLYKEFVHGRWQVPARGCMESETDKDWKQELFFESLSCGQEDLSE